MKKILFLFLQKFLTEAFIDPSGIFELYRSSRAQILFFLGTFLKLNLRSQALNKHSASGVFMSYHEVRLYESQFNIELQ